MVDGFINFGLCPIDIVQDAVLFMFLGLQGEDYPLN